MGGQRLVLIFCCEHHYHENLCLRFESLETDLTKTGTTSGSCVIANLILGQSRWQAEDGSGTRDEAETQATTKKNQEENRLHGKKMKKKH